MPSLAEAKPSPYSLPLNDASAQRARARARTDPIAIFLPPSPPFLTGGFRPPTPIDPPLLVRSGGAALGTLEESGAAVRGTATALSDCAVPCVENHPSSSFPPVEAAAAVGAETTALGAGGAAATGLAAGGALPVGLEANARSPCIALDCTALHCTAFEINRRK